ncbi:hypothetical protein SAY87_001202 [Trapa incisa]|uniref:PHD-type domain-containing protein n=1 Tax=Trapa incisa TaxID=236973 RepID=A0AAN7GD94_9MYRT|nr:hypothetical protein SAY87_001202 [Trapa incisa]
MPVKGKLRRGGRSEIAAKKMSSSASRKGSAVKNERKRRRLAVSDFESSEEDVPLTPLPRRGVAAETIRVCNGFSVPGKHVAEDRELTGWNGDGEEKKKKSRLDVFDFDEYDRIDWQMMLKRGRDGGGMGEGPPISPSLSGSGSRIKCQAGSSSHVAVASRKNAYFDRSNSLGSKKKQGVERIPLSAKREKSMISPDKLIQVQGKNGILKVHMSNKKKLVESSSDCDQWKSDLNQKGSSCEDMVKENAVALPASSDKSKSEKHSASSGEDENQLRMQKSVHTYANDSLKEDIEDTDLLLKQRSEAVRGNVIVYSSRSKKERVSISEIDGEGQASKINKTTDEDLDEVDASLERKPMEVEARDPSRKGRLGSERTPKAKVLKLGMGVKHVSSTEKQKLREHIRKMLLSSGWDIDYKPRRNRDYLDAVYISPSGTAYWSIIKAYDALQRQLDGEAEDDGGDRSAFIVSDEILSQLTRKTQKKMERELKKQRMGTENMNPRGTARKKTSHVEEDTESTQSDSDEKLSSFVHQKAKSFKGKHSNSSLTGLKKRFSKASSSSISPHQRESGKLGRCTLLICRSDKDASNSESDSFVPCTGKRTLISWLVDFGVVELSQKVQYMNQRKTQVLLEGWITRDGIRCGCCSIVHTVSKFELHAGGKTRQPFQNIYLDSGVSLLRCLKDAWNRQEESDHVGFHRVDINGDDPNDDTCGLCGDGGDLMCCDGCPSTFHLSCLNIDMLPEGDWHCPNCTCRYCGVPSEHDRQIHPAIETELLSCNLCQRRFHKSCLRNIYSLAADSFMTNPSYCSHKCKELFDHLQNYLGLNHELEEGFSWSLIRRIDIGTDLSPQRFPQMVECNAKLAVALSIMDECFLPIIDRRTGINMIHNVLYNCGSNFSRISYSGFYTAILERGDEIISAASLRFHGTQLAEMPFIGTRHVHRRQGMCRRLFSAIESVLQSLKIEKVVIPAISELTNTWNGVFGFTPAAESLKQEMRSLNMLVFPGLNMLQKLLFKQETTGSEETAAVSSAAMQNEQGKDNAGNLLGSDESDSDLSPEPKKDMDDSVQDVHFAGMAVNSAEPETKQTEDASSVKLQEVGAKLIKNGDIDGASEMVIEVSSIQTSPQPRGISREESRIVKSNVIQSTTDSVPLPDVIHSAIQMEEKLGQDLKEDQASKDILFVNSDPNWDDNHGEGRTSDGPAQNIGWVNNKSGSIL